MSNEQDDTFVEGAPEEPSRSNEPDPAMNFQGEMYSQPQYEFTPVENELIGGLAAKMRVVGLFGVLLGLINLGLPFVLFYALKADRFRVTPLVLGVMFLLVGIWTRSAGRSFEKITTTSGRDISNLMRAVDDLDSVYGLQYWLILIGLMILVGIVGFVATIDALGIQDSVFTY